MPFERSVTLAQELKAELATLGRMADRGYCLGLHIRRGVPMARYTTLDPLWIDHYFDRGFLHRDPCLAWAFGTNGAMRWHDPRLADPHGVLDDAARFGLKHGMVACFGAPRSLSVLVMARSRTDFTDDEMEVAFGTVRHLHSLASPPERLSKAQQEALRIIAGGKRYAAAAEQLGISESALKARLYTARERLMARTTPEAIRRAKDYGLI